jgi:hypothetical protein
MALSQEPFDLGIHSFIYLWFHRSHVHENGSTKGEHQRLFDSNFGANLASGIQLFDGHQKR